MILRRPLLPCVQIGKILRKQLEPSSPNLFQTEEKYKDSFYTAWHTLLIMAA